MEYTSARSAALLPEDNIPVHVLLTYNVLHVHVVAPHLHTKSVHN